MIWCIVLCSKIFGFSEFSVRLPSTLAALALCIYLFFSLRRVTGNDMYGFIVVAVLVTCHGYIRNHVTRTGEYDSLLVLFSTVFALHLFLATEATEQKQQSKHLLLFFIFLTLAVLTKGVAPIMQAPGLGIFVILRKKLLPFLKNKFTYIGLGIFLLFGLGYYFLREIINPGYLQAVWENELGGRFIGSQGHQGTFDFYWHEIIDWQFVEYIYLFPLALIIGLVFSESSICRLVLFAVITGLSFFLVVSTAATKLPHYDAPLFPYLAIIMASLFYFIYTSIKKRLLESKTYLIATAIAFICVAVLFVRPYSQIISVVYFPKGDSWEEGLSVSCRIFQDAVRKKVDINSYKLLFTEGTQYGPRNVLTCYTQQLKENGINTPIITDAEGIQPNDTVVLFSYWGWEAAKKQFDVTALQHLDHCNADVVVCKPKQALVQ
ncbi:MAG TPA: glycosyltransferase family 39 protein, partial [Chitinophagales bacterium]|nr:glycosyltransferase family 39 protein [Chitinophagales bacterium]